MKSIGSAVRKLGWQRLDDLDGFEAHADDLADEADDVLRVVLAVGVGGDAAALVGADLVLIDDPFEGRAVTEPIFERLECLTAPCPRITASLPIPRRTLKPHRQPPRIPRIRCGHTPAPPLRSKTLTVS